MNKFKTILILVLISMLVISCNEEKMTDANIKKNTSKAKEEIKKIPVNISIIKKTDLKDHIEISGKVEGVTDIMMVSETSGKIISIDKKLGDFISKGDKIGLVDNDDYKIRLDQATAALKAAEANLDMANIQYESSTNLFNKNSISKVEFLQSQAGVKNAQAGVDGAKANHLLSEKALNNSMLISPVSGYIVNLPIKIGEFLTMGSPVCAIVDHRELLIKTGIGESEITSLKKGQTVNISRVNDANISINGKITAIGIKPLRGTANYPIEIKLNNKEKKLLPGMIVKASITNKTYKNVIFISLDNIVNEFDKNFVFITNKEKTKVQKKEVILGKRIGEIVIVNSGINEGDNLVVSGIENLDEGSEIKIIMSIKK